MADVGGTRFWRIDTKADYGLLNSVSGHNTSFGVLLREGKDDPQKTTKNANGFEVDEMSENGVFLLK